MRRPSISYGFCAMVCVLAWYNARLCTCFLISILVHEAGHLIAGKLLQIPVEEIQFRLSGIVIRTGTMGCRDEALISAAGPAASMLLALLSLRVSSMLCIIAALHGAFNLLPIYPLDGGRILRIWLLCFCSNEHTMKIMNWISKIIISALMVVACWLTIFLQAGIWPIFAALVLLWRTAER